jgi:Na+:H+ antiporter, NhaA family
MGEKTDDKDKTRQLLIDQILYPFQDFYKAEAFGGILLIICTVAALACANSDWADLYSAVLHTNFTIGFEGFKLEKPLILWIDDGLMAIFFFVVGLEIKREALVGELSSLRQSMLPIAAAAGGMLFPAFFYIALNHGKPGAAGWGIPMATDIAFALGILSLLGKRVPLSLKIFLTAIAIIDDIGAVLVIALFYTSEIVWFYIAIAGGFLVILVVANMIGVRHPFVYALFGVAVWVAFLESGIHPTVAGVLIAMTIPSRTRIDTEKFSVRSQFFLNEFVCAGASGAHILSNEEQHAALQSLKTIVEHAESPLQRLEHALHPWVTYVIMPVFAFANAGVALDRDIQSALSHPIALGIMVGLILGKQVGITLFTWLMIRSGIARKPLGVSWRQIYGVSWLGGIGFTMSLFISNLAFHDPLSISIAKVAILSASLIAGMVGWFILKDANPEIMAQ